MTNVNHERLAETLESGVDFKSRTIYLIDDVCRKMSRKAIIALRQLDEKPGDITVILDSPGGDEYEGWAIYDAFKQAQNRITVVGTGYVMSMAALVLQMAAPGRRFLTANSRFMIHDGAQKVGEGYAAAHSSVVIAAGKEQAANNLRYCEVLARRSKSRLEVVQDLSLHESYFSAAEAVGRGFADRICFQLHGDFK